MKAKHVDVHKVGDDLVVYIGDHRYPKRGWCISPASRMRLERVAQGFCKKGKAKQFWFGNGWSLERK